MDNNTLTALNGVRVGHATNTENLAGCTVVLFDKAYPVAFASKGGTPRTYDTTTLEDGRSYYRKHALYIADGAFMGLETAAFIAGELRQQGVGFTIGQNLIPSISGACVQSPGMYKASIDPAFGASAVKNASNDPVVSGNVGAGTGTTVGKFASNPDNINMAMKSGVGSAKIELGSGVVVTALSVVNAIGNIIAEDGSIIAGNRNDRDGSKFRTFEGFSNYITEKSNTTISIVGINVALESQEDLRRVADIATHGQIRAINPVNTSLDGDTVFAFTTEELEPHLSHLGNSIEDGDWYKLYVDVIAQTAAKVVQESIYDACLTAESIDYKYAFKGTIPSVKDYK